MTCVSPRRAQLDYHHVILACFICAVSPLTDHDHVWPSLKAIGDMLGFQEIPPRRIGYNLPLARLYVPPTLLQELLRSVACVLLQCKNTYACFADYATISRRKYNVFSDLREI